MGAPRRLSGYRQLAGFCRDASETPATGFLVAQYNRTGRMGPRKEPGPAAKPGLGHDSRTTSGLCRVGETHQDRAVLGGVSPTLLQATQSRPGVAGLARPVKPRDHPFQHSTCSRRTDLLQHGDRPQPPAVRPNARPARGPPPRPRLSDRPWQHRHRPGRTRPGLNPVVQKARPAQCEPVSRCPRSAQCHHHWPRPANGHAREGELVDVVAVPNKFATQD